MLALRGYLVLNLPSGSKVQRAGVPDNNSYLNMISVNLLSSVGFIAQGANGRLALAFMLIMNQVSAH
jgi:hypothetical protein